MAATASQRGHPETPAELFTTRDGEEMVHKTNIEHEPTQNQILNAYDAESVEDLADQFTVTGRNIVNVRLGVVNGTGEDATFHSEEELLALVEGVSDALAAGLVDWFDDIPSLCEKLRREPTGALAHVLHDARVDDKEWVDDLDDLVTELDEVGPNFEQRLKNVDVWVEPQNETGGI